MVLREPTHLAINEEVARRSMNEFSLDVYLINQIGFSNGVREELNGIDADGKYIKIPVLRWLGYGGEREDRPGSTTDYLPLVRQPTRSISRVRLAFNLSGHPLVAALPGRN